ncbi:hypothetical protein F5X99DRAFT_87702 [Biscogniauxia marginata]|nr:hypothetical protein F5X99DRAFT_87702 [Biscogniauxia marginata]
MATRVYTHETVLPWPRPRLVHLHGEHEDAWDVLASGPVVQNSLSKAAYYITSKLLLTPGGGRRCSSEVDHDKCKFVGRVSTEHGSNTNNRFDYCLIKLDRAFARKKSIEQAIAQQVPIHYSLFKEATMDPSRFWEYTVLRARTRSNRLVEGNFIDGGYRVNIRDPAHGLPTHRGVSIVQFEPAPGPGCEGMWVYTRRRPDESWNDSALQWRFERPEQDGYRGEPFPDDLFKFKSRDLESHPRNKLRVVGMIIGELEKAPGFLVIRPMRHIFNHMDYSDDHRRPLMDRAYDNFLYANVVSISEQTARGPADERGQITFAALATFLYGAHAQAHADAH